MKEQIKELRVKIDGLSQLTKELKQLKECTVPIEGVNRVLHNANVHKWFTSQEVNQAYSSLILAKAWLGKLLGELGTENPYGSGYKTKEDIVPTQDVCNPKNDTVLFFGIEGDKDYIEGEVNKFQLKWVKKNHIEKVDWLRQEIQHVVHLIEQTIFTSNQSREFAIARTNSYNHLCEARFWLGFEMSRLRDEKTER